MKSPSFIVHKIIEKSDIVLEVLDARFIEETRNIKIEQKVKNKNKILAHVINKCDLADKKLMEEAKKTLENCIFVSAKEHLGTTLLKNKIRALAQRKGLRTPKVGVVGYPNVGKSSIINALKGQSAAKTSPEAGFTKGKQYVRMDNDFLLIDTPGVVAKETEEELVLIGAENPATLKDPDLAVIRLMKAHPGLIEKKYGVEVKDDEEETISDIALKLNLKKRGNLPDIERVSRKILKEWIDGKK